MHRSEGSRWPSQGRGRERAARAHTHTHVPFMKLDGSFKSMILLFTFGRDVCVCVCVLMVATATTPRTPQRFAREITFDRCRCCEACEKKRTTTAISPGIISTPIHVLNGQYETEDTVQVIKSCGNKVGIQEATIPEVTDLLRKILVLFVLDVR